MQKLFKFLFIVITLALSLGPTWAKPKADFFSPAQKKQLTKFFSSVANAQIPSFKGGQISDTALISFGIFYNIRENAKAFRPITRNGEMCRLPAHVVDQATMQFFGKSITRHHTVEEWSYHNGFYTVSLNEAEGDLTSQITAVSSLGSDQYLIHLKTYDDFGEATFYSTATATLKRVSATRFILTAYTLSKQPSKR